jgi:hypothetical protein
MTEPAWTTASCNFRAASPLWSIMIRISTQNRNFTEKERRHSEVARFMNSATVNVLQMWVWLKKFSMNTATAHCKCGGRGSRWQVEVGDIFKSSYSPSAPMPPPPTFSCLSFVCLLLLVALYEKNLNFPIIRSVPKSVAKYCNGEHFYFRKAKRSCELVNIKLQNNFIICSYCLALALNSTF